MPTAQQTKFIELRAKGLSLTQIATELDVCKRTLVNWGHKLEDEIQAHYALEQEALREQLMGFREQRLRRQGELLARVEAELQKRSLADLSTARLFSMAESLRRQILKETTSKMPSLPAFEETLNELPPGRESVPASPDQLPGSVHQETQIAQSASMPINSQPETIIDFLPEDRCKNGATSVQYSTGSIPSPPLEAEGQGEEAVQHQAEDSDGNCGHGMHLTLPWRQSQSLRMQTVRAPVAPIVPAVAQSTQAQAGRESVLASSDHLPGNQANDRCKNGAIPVQPDEAIRHKLSSEAINTSDCWEQPGGIRGTGNPEKDFQSAKALRGPTEWGQGSQSQQVQAVRPSAAGAAGVKKQSTINSVPDVQPLFKDRVLIEDLGRKLRQHFVRAK